jgi:anti-anti-sigma factor
VPYNPSMTLTERRLGDVTVLDLKGRLVLDEGDTVLRECLNRLIQEGRLKIVLNLGDVSYIDSCGIGVLIAKFVSFRRKGGDVRLLHVTSRSLHLLEISKLVDVFRMFDSEADAVASFDGGARS